MNRVQKIAWLFVITTFFSVLLLSMAVGILSAKFYSAKMMQGLVFLGIGGTGPFFMHSVAILIQYGRETKGEKS